MEMKPMFEESVFPFLQSLQPHVIYSTMVKVVGIGESKAETMIADLIETQTNPTIAPYAKLGEVHFRVTASAKGEKEAKELVKPVIKELKKRFKENIYTLEEKESLEDVVVNLLKKYELTVTTAESCTGGMISSTIINVPGCSDVFKEAFVTYSNRAKKKYLDVSKTTLKKYGAVSEQTAKEMVKGVAIGTDSDTALAVSGIAGPDGGTEEKPVGLVYIGCFIDGKAYVQKYQFKGTRETIRRRTVIAALDLLRRKLIEVYS